MFFVSSLSLHTRSYIPNRDGIHGRDELLVGRKLTFVGPASGEAVRAAARREIESASSMSRPSPSAYVEPADERVAAAEGVLARTGQLALPSTSRSSLLADPLAAARARRAHDVASAAGRAVPATYCSFGSLPDPTSASTCTCASCSSGTIRAVATERARGARRAHARRRRRRRSSTRRRRRSSSHGSVSSPCGAMRSPITVIVRSPSVVEVRRSRGASACPRARRRARSGRAPRAPPWRGGRARRRRAR